MHDGRGARGVPLTGQGRVGAREATGLAGDGPPDGSGGEGPPDRPVDVELVGAGEAVELLLEQVGEETEPQSAVSFSDLRGRTVIITGGATGIGRCTAIEFARRGTNVAFNWIDLPDRSIAEEAARTEVELQQLEIGVLAERVDVRDAAAVEAFVMEAHRRLGGLHYLVNAAGVHRSAPVWRMTDEEWREVLETNLTGAFNTIRSVAPIFREQNFGKIVNVASIEGVRGRLGLANYAASKSGLMGLTRVVAAELGPSNVNVNAVAPGFVRTAMLSGVPDELVGESQTRAALGRMSEAEDIAHVILFLCSEMARQITGQVIHVDGGVLG